ncbi:hypothetical protein CANCADRAFT_32265 [Tortispora caseinolytica NRRL Y-17796]|uniref:Elongator complex protein 2 n=1 Tax=Tortispora caseinolytica NRRL Y-17796 TaxID=767744 RepID=A0A1E4TAH6_9ASCO|nr:hypothetical protein CANCADRAFT_32265 [Tortispora caseinolytica NRRL Y-17796]
MALFAGANTHANASDINDTYLVYGSGPNVAVSDLKSTVRLLVGHTAQVTAVAFLNNYIVSGTQTGSLVIHDSQDWSLKVSVNTEFRAMVSALRCFDGLVYCAIDKHVCIYDSTLTLVDQIDLSFYSLAIEVATIGSVTVMFVAGSKSTIHVYARTSGSFVHMAAIPGHEDWVRALAYDNGILASASQDRTIRLWKIVSATDSASQLSKLVVKNYKISESSEMLFDALLFGHDDWIMTLRWRNGKLLSSSSDSSVIVWTPDDSGIWIPETRLGSVSIKGASTATGASGGIWSALWTPAGGIAAVSRTGSWRIWLNGAQQLPITGHTGAVTGMSWSPEGEYLLSTSTDQTTRLWACWMHNNPDNLWHEMSRPQIHGYDMVTCTAITSSVFVSAAEEKILRVFQLPKPIASLIHTTVSPQFMSSTDAAAAIVPTLGLSNKAVNDSSSVTYDDTNMDREVESGHLAAHIKTNQPPSEDDLERHTLWPELDKLYGHGYEISALDASPKSGEHLIATACRANKEDNAVIRLFSSSTDSLDAWNQDPDLLKAHHLTVNCIRFSPDGKYILSVSRDRSFALFDVDNKQLLVHQLKAHSRLLWSCSWVLSNNCYSFVTSGRDNTLKLWSFDPSTNSVALLHTQPTESAVTATATIAQNNSTLLAAGQENGGVLVFRIIGSELIAVPRSATWNCASTVRCMAWRPRSTLLAVGSDDHSVRLLNIDPRIDGQQ